MSIVLLPLRRSRCGFGLRDDRLCYGLRPPEETLIGEGSGVDPDAIELGVVVDSQHWGGQSIAVEVGLAAARDLFERSSLTVRTGAIQES